MTSNTDTTHAQWVQDLSDSARLRGQSVEAGREGRALLWRGAQAAIEEWKALASADANGDGLYALTMAALGGKARKGDASKIRTVALAVKDHGLVLGQFKSLSAAYREAYNLTKGAAAAADEDAVATAKAKLLAAEMADATPSTPEDAAKIVLSNGVNVAAALLLDALGNANDKAHRSFLRAVLDEVAKRAPQAAQPKGKTGPAQPKAGAVLPGEVGVKAKPEAPVPAKTKAKPKPATKGTPKVQAPPAVPVKTKAKAPIKAPAKAPAQTEAPAKPKPKGRVVRKAKA